MNEIKQDSGAVAPEPNSEQKKRSYNPGIWTARKKPASGIWAAVRGEKV